MQKKVICKESAFIWRPPAFYESIIEKVEGAISDQSIREKFAKK